MSTADPSPIPAVDEVRLEIDESVARLALHIMDGIGSLPVPQLRRLDERFKTTTTIKLTMTAASEERALALIGYSYATAVVEARKKRLAEQVNDPKAEVPQ